MNQNYNHPTILRVDLQCQVPSKSEYFRRWKTKIVSPPYVLSLYELYANNTSKRRRGFLAILSQNEDATWKEKLLSPHPTILQKEIKHDKLMISDYMRV
jgi:hypothetical protein